MKKFIIIMQFDKNNYSFNIKSKNVKKLIKDWYNIIDYKNIFKMGIKYYKKLYYSIVENEDNPTRIESVNNIWYVMYSPLWNGKKTILNIFEVRSSVFSYFLQYKGGTYISQNNSINLENSINLWLKNELKSKLIVEKYISNDDSMLIEKNINNFTLANNGRINIIDNVISIDLENTERDFESPENKLFIIH